MPAGYDHVRRSTRVGHGEDQFRAAAEALLRWEVHRAAGLTVQADTASATPASRVVLGLGVGPVRVHAPCRVRYVVDEPRRRGFAYDTMPGHPVQGVEVFWVTLHDDGDVVFTISAVSRPARWWSRLARPITRRVQRRITDRYLRALVRRR